MHECIFRLEWPSNLEILLCFIENVSAFKSSNSWFPKTQYSNSLFSFMFSIITVTIQSTLAISFGDVIDSMSRNHFSVLFSWLSFQKEREKNEYRKLFLYIIFCTVVEIRFKLRLKKLFKDMTTLTVHPEVEIVIW